jgi:hypothetical protein
MTRVAGTDLEQPSLAVQVPRGQRRRVTLVKEMLPVSSPRAQSMTMDPSRSYLVGNCAEGFGLLLPWICFSHDA